MFTRQAALKEKIRKLLPTSPRDHRIISGPLRGARICTSLHDYPGAILGTTEGPLVDWIHRCARSGETWIDIGAHYGYTAIALSQQVGVSGRVFAFEPVPSTAQCICRTRELNGLRQLTVVPFGLHRHSEPGTQDLPVIRGMADSTIMTAKWTQRVTMASFDSLWPALCHGHQEIHGAKIDVQGMELDVLLGMKNSLVRWVPKLVVEFHRGVEREAVFRFLESCGYDTQWRPVDPSGPQETFADDMSYAFERASS